MLFESLHSVLNSQQIIFLFSCVSFSNPAIPAFVDKNHKFVDFIFQG